MVSRRFIAEGCQPSELGWGTHELKLPTGAHFHESGCKSSIYLTRPGASVRIKTWTPAAGPCLGFLITHNESISLSDYLTIHDGDSVSYRPTVNYAYHPCNDAILSLHELSGTSWRPQQRRRVISGNDILEGADYLGVLLMGHERNAYWYGSILENGTAQALNPKSSATTLQVAAGVLAGLIWALENPRHGIVEAEEMDFQFILNIAQPYLGDLVGIYTNWSPGNNDKQNHYPSTSLQWQFENFLE
ncbi:saccharopine dehydrogenase C-terminal domain-containing protein [Pseudomonas sp. 10-1B]|uniref:saccharopine dehydrogenase C-terminal domain-containing protein n=1 Tax=Pseudomonas sp. 10-1B TaxID=1546029 RepID=UPI001364D1FA|nr:saccharopine dehydrogenase C-terminal domain-containing protein [Pseudomonas sp. 10-1B]